ncbi:hypothetical protein GGI25_002139 [Coemansia spiralis]|uniref:Methyltransferase domain-containing protein n=2 Tax=Coemansia TaxID=4863 RepID=A0A9W8G4F2_9FUNG|nr:methyltransferase domain-containing protein [Coemansia spiralis]KAJ1995224.1 hypothetical protein EDC05_001062 [Coemansia umbellata]KAJ2625624.1 hypothetical protein GGI26_000424 [Coemansia sp. RSA 1358]KAJ2678754.1 hypothetical protein GGI25_002139 [Coemansia spiralis]
MVRDKGIRLPEGFDSIEQYTEELKNAYDRYAYLLVTNIMNFFVTEQWKNLPKEWRWYFDSPLFDVSSLIAMAAHGRVPDGAPETLKSYVNAMFRLRIPRETTLAIDEKQKKTVALFMHGMSEKKRDEVLMLSKLVDQVACETGSKMVVDVGAGQGYLSRVLAFSASLGKSRVLAVDFSETQKRGAEVLQKSMVKMLKSKRAKADGYAWDESQNARLTHQVLKVDMGGSDELVAAAQNIRKDKHEHWMLCGLHACGDLSSAILKAFAESDAAAVVLVPCCYNLITELGVNLETHCSAIPGFPMSQAFRGVKLGTHALKAACQAPMRWENDAACVHSSFERNYFRALLHYLMVSHGQLSADDRGPAIGSVTRNGLQAAMAREHRQLEDSGLSDNDEGKRFAVYTLAALEKIKHPWRPSVAQCIECQRGMQHGLSQVAAAWTLMSLAGPVIESMLVVDRALYLGEHCGAAGTVQAFALFDAVASPRNMVLVAQRAGLVQSDR